MTDYGSNFDITGQKHAFDSLIHKMFAEVQSKSQADFMTFDEYNNWVTSIYAKYQRCFNTSSREAFEDAHGIVNNS